MDQLFGVIGILKLLKNDGMVVFRVLYQSMHLTLLIFDTQWQLTLANRTLEPLASHRNNPTFISNNLKFQLPFNATHMPPVLTNAISHYRFIFLFFTYRTRPLILKNLQTFDFLSSNPLNLPDDVLHVSKLDNILHHKFLWDGVTHRTIFFSLGTVA